MEINSNIKIFLLLLRDWTWTSKNRSDKKSLALTCCERDFITNTVKNVVGI